MRRIALTLALVAALGGALRVLVRRPPGAVLYRGGPILTLDGTGQVAEALGTEGDRIAAVGSEPEFLSWARDRGARVVELRGRTLVPGFIDAHGHFPGTGLFALFVDLQSPPGGPVEDLAGLVARLGARARKTPEGQWVIGLGYDDTLLAEGRHPTRYDLDRASSRHPVAAVHVSGHLAAVNSAALAELGIGAATPDPEGGRIHRDPARGEPDGVLEETAMLGVSERLRPGLLGSLRMLRRAVRDSLAAGITTAQSGLAPAGLIRALGLASRLGLLPLRVVVWPDADAADAMLAGEIELESPGPAWLRVGAIKLVADGSIQGYTAWLRDPYHVPPSGRPGWRGYPRMDPQELRERVLRYHATGLQVAVHGNGDAAIDIILEAIEEAQSRHPRPDPRHIVVHAQTARPDQLDTMARLGVIPSFFVLHTFYWGDRHRDIFLGPERARRISPAAGAGLRGIPFTLHADAPVVPMEPLRIVDAAVNRTTRTGVVLGPEERIAPLAALRAITADAARQHFEEHEKGSLEPGKLADLVILSRSPLEDRTRLLEIEVEETIVGGRSVYRRGSP